MFIHINSVLNVQYFKFFFFFFLIFLRWMQYCFYSEECPVNMLNIFKIWVQFLIARIFHDLLTCFPYHKTINQLSSLYTDDFWCILSLETERTLSISFIISWRINHQKMSNIYNQVMLHLYLFSFNSLGRSFYNIWEVWHYAMYFNKCLFFFIRHIKL